MEAYLRIEIRNTAGALVEALECPAPFGTKADTILRRKGVAEPVNKALFCSYSVNLRHIIK